MQILLKFNFCSHPFCCFCRCVSGMISGRFGYVRNHVAPMCWQLGQYYHNPMLGVAFPFCENWKYSEIELFVNPCMTP